MSTHMLTLTAFSAICLLLSLLPSYGNQTSFPYREMLSNQPSDPFIDLLKRRLNHSAFVSFRTQREGKDFIEASTVVRYPVDEILGLYTDAFEAENLPYDVHRSDYHAMVVFKGFIDGAEKRILLKPNPESGNVIVRLYSEQFGHAFTSKFKNVYDHHPELKQLSGERLSENHYDHHVAHSGMIRLRVNGGDVEHNTRRLVDELHSQGWRHDETSSAENPSPVLAKGNSHILIIPAAHTGNRTTFALYVRHLDTP